MSCVPEAEPDASGPSSGAGGDAVAALGTSPHATSALVRAASVLRSASVSPPRFGSSSYGTGSAVCSAWT